MKFPFVLRSQYDDAMKVIESLNERLDKVHDSHRKTVQAIEAEQRERLVKAEEWHAADTGRIVKEQLEWNEQQAQRIKSLVEENEKLRIAGQAAAFLQRKLSAMDRKHKAKNAKKAPSTSKKVATKATHKIRKRRDSVAG